MNNFKLPKTTVASRLLILALVAGALIVACSQRNQPQSYQVPTTMWSVQSVAPEHAGDPLLLVRISDQFAWPQSTQPITYHVTIIGPGQQQIENVGQITAIERFAVVLLPHDSDELTGDVAQSQQAETTAGLNAALERLTELTIKDDVSASIAEFEKTYGNFLGMPYAESPIVTYEVELVPYLGDRGVARQEGERKKAEPSKYNWGTEVTDEKDACKGKKPEACALEKLKKIKDRICEAKKLNGTPRFPKECEYLTARLAKDPPEPKIVCMIPAKAGTTAGETEPLTGVITLNGDEFLGGPCPDGIVIHEVTHALEFLDPDKYKNLKKLREAQARLKKALDDEEKAKQANKQDDFDKAHAEAKKAVDEIMKLNGDAAKDLIQSECNALFATLDNADFFGYPGDGTACVKTSIKAMVGQLGSIKQDFELPPTSPPVKGPMCDCFKKMRDWVSNHKDIKDNFDRDVFMKHKTKGDITWTKALEGLTKGYCGG